MMKKTLLTLTAMLSLHATAQTLPYQNPALTAEVRADDLLGRLTLEEKAKLMMDTSPAIARLGIPAFQWWNEALHGIGRNGFVTVFPITTMMAASWDDALLYQVFTAVSDEARAKNQEAKHSGKVSRYQGLSFWTPNINIYRDPRWGRGQETYGEDPYLLSMDCKVKASTENRRKNVMQNCWHVPNTLLCIVVRNGIDTRSIFSSCQNVTSGKPISQLSRLWYRKVRWLK
jgi:beta-glucosidase-like glycosyl hydrolase